ncbi:patatin-like phospholipase family protein [Ottowia thiooxydans]|uniref:patatin-like phospholipase family protein n=1 Tax=Ottowia thiooxydans TaxID=219182 RepID=UPI0004900676|nr:patatin-like phospholipase family protein [Ottowia thiooxydans]
MKVLTSTVQGNGSHTPRWQFAVDAEGSRGLWDRLKGLFSRPVKGVESLINVREVFKSFFQEQASALGQDVPLSHRAGLMDRAQGLMQQILRDSLDNTMEEAIARGDGKIREEELLKTVARANDEAQLALMQLQAHALRARLVDEPMSDLRPQIVIRADQSIQLIRPAPRIENLVLRGGGAKGVGNAPALVEMEQAGLLTNLKKIVGTSVGALTAVSLASGQDAQAFSGLAVGLDMTTFRNKPENFGERYPGIDLSCRIGFHAGRALELLDEVSAGNVSAYLKENWNNREFQQKFLALRDSEGHAAVARLAGLRAQDFGTDRTAQMITFGDLARMHRLDPTIFKELVLTGWDDTNNRMSYFSAESTPSMPIAVAGRLSMSFPIIFKPVTVDPGDGLGVRTFVDGGVGSNMPTEVIMGNLQGRDAEEARSRTAIMTFDEAGKAYDVMHRPPAERSGFIDWIVSMLSGNPNYGQAAASDDSKVRDMGPNAFVIFHGDMGTLDLRASPERVEKAKLMSTLKTLEQIDQRRGQAYAVDCNSVQECFSLLTNSEKAELKRGGAPSPFDYQDYVTDPAYRAQLSLYHMAISNDQQNEPNMAPRDSVIHELALAQVPIGGFA